MSLPFTPDQFFAVFAAYNETVFPMPLVLLVVGLWAAWMALRPTAWADRSIGLIVAALWLWMGAVYQWMFFAAVNPAARVFGAAFVAEGVLLLWYLAIRRRVRFRAAPTWRGAAGLALLIYAFVVYPAVGWALGHRYPAMPTFGLPCPTTIATLGLMLWAEPRAPLPVLVVPWLWALVGTGAALQLGVWEDLGLLVAAGLSLLGWVVAAPRTTPRTAGYSESVTRSSPSRARSS
jgi:Family of unknown function (DUF6064)